MNTAVYDHYIFGPITYKDRKDRNLWAKDMVVLTAVPFLNFFFNQIMN
jgi:hypothetical protein